VNRFLAVLGILVLTLFFAHRVYSQDEKFQITEPMAEEELGLEEAPVEAVKKELPPINMVYVKGGCYQMGDFTGEGDDDERPVHEVCVGDFYMSDTEVTNELWEAAMEFQTVEGADPKAPVANITWFMVNRFISRLNDLTNGFYRMPTEAEWEYAAREGGKKMLWAGTNDEDALLDYAWFLYNADDKPQTCKQKKPNALGLYDMSGNVWEWVEDNFDFDYYQSSPKEDPFGPDFALWRIIRGGSFIEEPHKLRTTYRHAYEPALRNNSVGFRLAQ